MGTTELRPHPVAKIFPDLTPAEYSYLLEDVKTNGVRIPIVVTEDGEIVDGVHRWTAAKEAGVDIPTVLFQGDSNVSLWEAGIKLNVARRNLTESQIAQVWADYEDVLPPGRPKESEREDLVTLSDAARAIRVSKSTLSQARRVKRQGTDELIGAVKNGVVAVSDAAAISKEDESVQTEAIRRMRSGNAKTARKAVKDIRRAQIAEAGAKAASSTNRYRVHRLPVADLSCEVEAGSVDLVVTDPPYDRESIDLFRAAAEFAVHALRDGGSLLMMAGNMFIPDIHYLLRESTELDYQWTLAYQMPGSNSSVHPRNVSQMWKPVLWFTKGRYTGKYVRDMVSAKLGAEQTNEHHKWGQTETGAEALLYQFLRDADSPYHGGVVCDPMVGGGAFGVVALSLGCGFFIGNDISAESVNTTKKRLDDACTV